MNQLSVCPPQDHEEGYKEAATGMSRMYFEPVGAVPAWVNQPIVTDHLGRDGPM